MHKREEIGLYADGLSSAPRPARRSRMHDWGWDPKRIPVLLACIALSALLASGAVVAFAGSGVVRATISMPMLSEASEGGIAPNQAPPPPPYEIFGFTYADAGKTTVLPDCIVNITNTRTGDWNLTFSTADYGFYRFDLWNQTNDWQVGDIINVTAYKDMAIGWTEAEATGGAYIWADVCLTAVIPEFPMVVLPVVGMLAVLAVVSFVRRRQ